MVENDEKKYCFKLNELICLKLRIVDMYTYRAVKHGNRVRTTFFSLSPPRRCLHQRRFYENLITRFPTNATRTIIYTPGRLLRKSACIDFPPLPHNQTPVPNVLRFPLINS